jgi:hypothetical protein
MNPYDPAAAREVPTNGNSRPTPNTAWAIALTPIVWALFYLLLISAGIEEICDRHPQARDMPIGYAIFAVACLLISIPVNYLIAVTVFRSIVRSPYMRFGSDLMAVLIVAGLIASSLAPLAVSQVPGLTPLQEDHDALVRPFVIASLVSALSFFGLTRDGALALPPTIIHAFRIQALRLWRKQE